MHIAMKKNRYGTVTKETSDDSRLEKIYGTKAALERKESKLKNKKIKK